MKINQRNLELKTLKCVVTFDQALDKATEAGLKDKHFLTFEPGSEISIAGKLFSLAIDYAKNSGGSKLTETVLESLLLQKGLPPVLQNKFLKVWYELQEEDVLIDEIPHFIALMKQRYCVHLMSKCIDGNTVLVGNDQIKEAVLSMSDCVNKMQEELDEFQQDKVSFNMADAKDFFMSEFDQRSLDAEASKGIFCGLSQIDSKTFGLMPSQLVCILAPSSGGKSVEMLNWADFAWRTCKKNVLYFSFEMSAWLCKLRHASLISEIDYSHLKGLNLNVHEREQCTKAFDDLQKENYFIYEEAINDPTPEYIETKIREISAMHSKPDLIVVDYVGNMTTRTTSKNAKHWEKNGDAAEGLFKIAKRYNLPVLTAQQINRSTITENRKRKEDGKSSSYYQDAASGDQRLMHLSTYVIGMEPSKEENLCWYHPVKMRDAWFMPFASQWIPEYNKRVELSDAQQSSLSKLKTAEHTTNSLDFIKPVVEYEPVDLDLSGLGDIDF
jgi:replicative DNA helicase